MTISVSGQFEQLTTTEDIVPLGNPHGMGNDTFSAAFTLSGGRSGDAYYCLALNNMSMTSNHILLKGNVYTDEKRSLFSLPFQLLLILSYCH